VSLAKYTGKVCLVVNTASGWGLTKVNYSQLQKLHQQYSADGLSILAFPSNSFNQEPLSNEEVEKFSVEKYGAEFDLFAKVDVNGSSADPLFQWLQTHSNCKGFLTNKIKWNFTKFLIGRDGIPVKRYGPKEDPISFEKDIKKLVEGKSIGTKMWNDIVR